MAAAYSVYMEEIEREGQLEVLRSSEPDYERDRFTLREFLGMFLLKAES
jgi:hypothetical protein